MAAPAKQYKPLDENSESASLPTPTLSHSPVLAFLLSAFLVFFPLLLKIFYLIFISLTPPRLGHGMWDLVP